MANVSADRVKETTTTTGTGALTLAGAATGFRTFASVLANGDTCFYVVSTASGAEWEVGLGTYTTAGAILTRTTILSSSNAGAAVSFSAGSKDVFITTPALGLRFDKDGNPVWAGIVTEPAAPAASLLTMYAKNVGGRMLPKFVGPSGIDSALQPAIFQNRVITYVPSSGTVGTGVGTGLGPAWTSAGTVTHPTPSTTAPAITNQTKRTMWANVVTTTNQVLGIRAGGVSERQFWRGNASGLGGFFFQARFTIELWPATTVRLFVGLVGNNNTHPVSSDTVINDTVGLWHDTTDPASGANSLNLVTRNAATTTKTSIALSNALAAGNSYDFYMFHMQNGSEVFYLLKDIVNGVDYTGSSTTTLPTNTVFMQPMAGMSNGTANITVTTTAFGLCGLYVEADR